MRRNAIGAAIKRAGLMLMLLASAASAATRYPVTIISGTTTTYVDTVYFSSGVDSITQTKQPRRPQPGDLLPGLIRICGFKESVGCGCHEFRARMNRWGWWGCWRHRQEIYEWLAVKAAERGILVEQAAFWPLFRQAFRQAAASSPRPIR